MCYDRQFPPSRVLRVSDTLFHGRSKIEFLRSFNFLMNKRQAYNVGYFASPLVKLPASVRFGESSVTAESRPFPLTVCAFLSACSSHCFTCLLLQVPL